MTAPLQLVIKDINRTESISSFIKERFARLRRLLPHITHGRVVLSKPHRSKRQGNGYRLGITLALPSNTLVVEAREEPNLFSAIAKGFKILERRLKTEHAKRSAHPPGLHPHTAPV